MSATVEDLLKLLEEPDESPVSSHSDSKISDFIDEFKIAPGIDRVDNYIIYYTYSEVYGGSLSKVEFFRQMTSKFSNYKFRTGKRRGFSLDRVSFDLSREGLIEAEFHNKGKR